MAEFVKRGNRFFVREPKISTQFLGFGKTKKEASLDFNDSLLNIFSDERDRKPYRIKIRGM